MFEEENILEDAYRALAAGDYINAYYLFSSYEEYTPFRIEGIQNYNYALIFIRLGEYDKALQRLKKALDAERKKFGFVARKDENMLVSINPEYRKLLQVQDQKGEFFAPLPDLGSRVIDYYQLCIHRMTAYCYYCMGNKDMLKMTLFDLIQEYGRENFSNFLHLVEEED